ncbi:MAG: hypothetical protein V4733_09685 [Verrucomicrobiota bacterium]
MEADITNALIRCTRVDQAAQPAFELVRDDLDLWVRELPENFSEIVGDLLKIRPLLRQLRTGSSDYTLHLAATIDEMHSLAIPPALAEIAGDCGFVIELIAAPL